MAEKQGEYMEMSNDFDMRTSTPAAATAISDTQRRIRTLAENQLNHCDVLSG